jgi:hypothetical protein
MATLVFCLVISWLIETVMVGVPLQSTLCQPLWS